MERARSTQAVPVPVVVIAASAGGLTPLCTLAAGLPSGFPAAILVASHLPAVGQSRLPGILSSAGPLPAWYARDREPIEPGRIYVAPPDHHLLVGRDARARLDRGPRENGVRPAADPLFRSAALAAGRGAIGVVLSGHGRDGAAGVAAIHAAGGIGIIQAPEDARVPFMPRHALAMITPHACVPAAALASILGRLVGESPRAIRAPPSTRGRALDRAHEPVSLRGMRVLVAEDDYLLSAHIVGMLRDLGCATRGPVPDVGSGLRLLERDLDGLDGAVLDVDLRGALVYPLAAALLERGVAIVFATGYGGAALPAPWSSHPHVQKPFGAEVLARAVRAALGSPRPRAEEATPARVVDGRCAELERASRDLIMRSKALRRESDDRLKAGALRDPSRKARGEGKGTGAAQGRDRRTTRRRR